MRDSVFKLPQNQNSSKDIKKSGEIRIWDFDLRPIPVDHETDWEYINRCHKVHTYVVGPNPPAIWWSI
jgi:hypothetical protein